MITPQTSLCDVWDAFTEFEQGAEVGEQRRRAVEVRIRHADGSPAECKQPPVAGPISLEGRIRAVRLAPIELDDQSLAAKEAVSLDHLSVELDQDVELGSGHPVAVDQIHEPHLEGRSGTAPGRDPELLQGGGKGTDTTLPRVAVDEHHQHPRIEPVRVFGLADDCFQRPRRQAGCKVEDRACQGCDRNAMTNGDLIWRKRGAVPPQRTGSVRREGCRHLDRHKSTVADDPPELCGRAMAENGALPAPHGRREPDTRSSDPGSSDRINAGVHRIDATRPQSAVDSTCAQSEVQKLASRHYSMLPFGQLHDAVID